jgi:hypothetical protein
MLIWHCPGGIPVPHVKHDSSPGGTGGRNNGAIFKSRKRRKRIANREKLANAKKKAVLASVKASFKSVAFQARVAFWDSIDQTPTESCFEIL